MWWKLKPKLKTPRLIFIMRQGLLSGDLKRKRRCSTNVLTAVVLISLLVCLGIFIYIAVVMRELHSMKDVAFSASEVAHIYATDSPETLKFKSVTRNSNAAYNPLTGHFIVPTDGTYMFMAQICSFVTSTFPFSDMYLSITVDDIVRGTSHVDHNASNKTICARVSAVEVMRRGEHAYVTVYSLNPKSEINTASANTFSGSRIN